MAAKSAHDRTASPLGELLSRLGTQSEVAELLGATVDTVSRWGRMRNRPDPANTKQLLDVVRARLAPAMTAQEFESIIAGRMRLADTEARTSDTVAHEPADWPPDVENAVSGAQELAELLGGRVVSDTTLDRCSRQLTRLTTEFVHRPPEVWMPALLDLWHRLKSILSAGTHPRQTQPLYVLSGMTSVVLAHGCHVVGNSDEGLVLARTAENLAEAIGHRELTAWALGTRALISDTLIRRSPIDDSPLDLVDRALAVLGSSRSTGLVRLHTYRARFAAGTGDRRVVREAQADALRARDLVDEGTGDLDGVGGVLTFPYAKHMALSAGVNVTTGDFDGARRAADLAITAYEQGPAWECSLGDLAIARLDKATAQAATGQLDAAEAAARPVLDLRDADRIAPLVPALHRLARQLGAPQVRGRTARELREEIAGLGGSRVLPAGTISA